MTLEPKRLIHRVLGAATGVYPGARRHSRGVANVRHQLKVK